MSESESSTSTRNPSVKVPRDKNENRLLKEGFEEEDNEDIAYLNFRLIWPVGVATFLSLFFMALSIGTMELMEHVWFERYAYNQLFLMYGKMRGICNNTFPYETGMYPSILRQVEMKVLSNIFFRVAVCVPMAIRILVALLIRNSYREDERVTKNETYRLANEIAGCAAVMEILSFGIFAITTIRFDFPEIYRFCFCVFVFSVVVYMLLRTILSCRPQATEPLDTLSFVVKVFCTPLFGWTASQFFDLHQQFITSPGCHGYVHPKDAITEYVMLTTYLLFQLTQLIDIRDVRFLCYPRTCSGECEPLRPENFAPGGKYEHCRAYELRQRELLGF